MLMFTVIGTILWVFPILIGDLRRLLVFVTCVGVIYVLAARYLLLAVLRRHQGYKPAPQVRRLRALTFILASLGVVCFAYGYFVEPHWLQVTHVSIRSPRIRPGASLRIVHISDLHSGVRPHFEDRLPALIAAQHPDVIVFTGDTVVNERGLPRAQDLFNSLSAIAPLYAVRGNLDERFKSELLALKGAHTLEREVAEVDIRGNRVYLLGADVGSYAALPNLVRSSPVDGFHLLLYHSPDEIEKIGAVGGVDLYCAGHTHGGQVALPWYGAVITFTRLGKKYESGLYRVGDTYLYINRGLGMDAPRVRFFARPEITVIDVQPTA